VLNKLRGIRLYVDPTRWPNRDVVWPAFSWFFCILCAYYVIRPIRETMGVELGKDRLNWLFLATFIAMLIATPIYAACVARLSRKRLIATVYHFFAVTLLSFWWLFQTEAPEVRQWVASAFFIWVGVFSLYATSVFWSVLTDLFSSSHAKQSFGFIAAGGTTGAIAGSLAASFLSHHLATHTLLLLPVVLLECGLGFAAYLQRRAVAQQPTDAPEPSAASSPATSIPSGAPTGGGVVDGVVHVVRSPYLLAICLSLFLGQLCGTQIYMQQAEIVKHAIADEAGRTKLFADMNLGVQMLTLVLQASVAGLLTRRLGLSIALAATPIAYTLAFATLGVSPSLAVFVIADVIRRGLTYGVMVPAREILFTVLSRDDKYKSKGFIDTVILRGGDAMSSQLLAGAHYLLASPASIQFVMLFIGGLWVAVSVKLAAWQRKLALSTPTEEQVR
jgi:ATP:ADP antiporter, AAA family